MKATQKDAPRLYRPSAPYLVVVVGRVGAGIIVGDYHDVTSAVRQRTRFKHEDPDLDFAIVRQGQDGERAAA